MSFKHHFAKPLLILLCISLTACDTLRQKQDEDDPDSWSVERLYEEAKNELGDSNWDSAIEFYSRLETRFPYGQYAEQAQIEKAYAHYKNAEPELATVTVEQFIRLYPTHPKADYAYYLKGLINYNEDHSFMGRVTGRDDLSDRDPERARNALAAFRDLVRRYPDSRYTGDAERRMAHLRNALAQHDLNVAKYYERRGAWVAVINRAKYVVENYETTPTVEDALGMMVRAYRQMGMENLATDTERVISSNFPNSSYLTQKQESL